MSTKQKIQKIIGYILIFLPFVLILRNYLSFAGEPHYQKTFLSDYFSMLPLASPFFLISVLGFYLAQPFKNMKTPKTILGVIFLLIPINIICFSLYFLQTDRSAGWDKVYILYLGVPSSIIYSIIAAFWIKFKKYKILLKVLLILIIITLQAAAIILLLQVDTMIE
ncbi:MAG: hypothetical protein P9M11_07790 [Candidatus Tenebribacter burtonii]|nr:hypothetical protein [Candidatus Tenebribacter burtonii]